MEDHSLIEIDSSDEVDEMCLMVLAIQVLIQERKKGENVHFGCKRSIEAEAEGIKILTNKMKVSNRSQYFK